MGRRDCIGARCQSSLPRLRAVNIFECEVKLSLCLLFGAVAPRGMRSVSGPDRFIPRERDHGAYCIGGWVGFGVVWTRWRGKSLATAGNQLVAYLLYRLSHNLDVPRTYFSGGGGGCRNAG